MIGPTDVPELSLPAELRAARLSFLEDLAGVTVNFRILPLQQIFGFLRTER